MEVCFLEADVESLPDRRRTLGEQFIGKLELFGIIRVGGHQTFKVMRVISFELPPDNGGRVMAGFLEVLIKYYGPVAR